VANALGEVVGLGLRNLANCPVEMNLMPDSTLRWQRFNEKKPYFIATVFSLVLVVYAVGLLFERLARSKEDELAKIQPDVQMLQEKSDQFNSVYKRLLATQRGANQIAELMQDRYYWSDVLTELRRALILAENDVQKKLSAQRPGVQAGIWIEQMTTMSTADNNNATALPPNYERPQMANPNPPPDTSDQTNQTGVVTLVCRAVSLSGVDPSANTTIAYALEDELRASSYFDPKATQLSGQITADDASGTFTFGVVVVLKNPLNL
jgi:hypothetical protein